MRVLNPIRNVVFASTLALASAPGCGGDAFPGPGAEALPRSQEQALACENMVPVMTGATTPSGTVTRSGVYDASYEAWQAFDGSTGSMWISTEGQTPAWIGYQWASGTKLINRYAIHYVNGSITTRAPKQWTFEGWNGNAWVVLDTRTNQVNWTGNERREFAVTSPGAYSRYRLNISDDNDTRSGIVVISMGRLELLNCATSTYPAANAAWTKTTGSAGGFTRVHDLVGDPVGRTYITGMTQPGLDGSPLVGLMDAFLQARDANGNKLWSVQIGAPGGLALGYGIARNRTWEDIYVGGFVDGSVDGTPTTGYREALLTKYRYTGVRQWTRQLGNVGSNTEGFGVAVDGLDNAFIAGTVEGALDGNPAIGTSDAFVAKYDSAGNRLWTRKVGAAGTRTDGRRVSADSVGNVYVSGWTEGGLDGNVRMGPQDLFVVKYNAAGVKQWTRQLGSSTTAVWLYGSAVDPAGSIYVSGYSGGGLDGNPNPTGGSDAFVTKYDAAGVKQWTREIGGAGGGSWSMGLFIDDSGVYLSGSGSGDVGNPSGAGTGAAHNFVARYDTAGNRQWVVQQDAARLNGADVVTYATGVSADWSGNLYVGGFTSGTLGGSTVMGDPHGFVTRLPMP
ncbi:SBBP repeat-containing protein [Pyxidicoccus parkwayensis]|uniref:SBBP repeat-containing protein n=1 Tax=Pyxidicoccus parkwayensis TaxID=2813578 RepID=A0ABX7P681_9BACT|nr:SBBP repeat-containing protein [Pyxidicoccus parkwaysis]QSQ26004.1 SBBP repeat-containing protein [Pyxidicoccus parkwaysis]